MSPMKRASHLKVAGRAFHRRWECEVLARGASFYVSYK